MTRSWRSPEKGSRPRGRGGPWPTLGSRTEPLRPGSRGKPSRCLTEGSPPPRGLRNENPYWYFLKALKRASDRSRARTSRGFPYQRY